MADEGKETIETLAQAYEMWWEKVKPNNPLPVQTLEMRRAFYSGAYVMFGMLVYQAGPMDEPDDVAIRKYEERERELKEFAQAVVEGRA